MKRKGGEKKKMHRKKITYIKIGKTVKRIVANEGAFGFLPGDIIAIKSTIKIPKVKSTKGEETEFVEINKNNGNLTVLGTNHHDIHVNQRKKLYTKDKYGNVKVITEESKQLLEIVKRFVL